MQDGDEERVARLHDLPAPEQAAEIREALGIRKRVAVSIGLRERLRRIGFGSNPQEKPTLRARTGEKDAA
jgi:hypothetical protein